MATMDELQMRIEVQDAVVGMAMNLMGQNNVPPHLVMDALVKAEARVSEYVMVEMVNAAMEHTHEHVEDEAARQVESMRHPVQEAEGEVI